MSRGPDWMPITPKTGSLFHAETHGTHRVDRAADRTMQVHGGIGYSRHKPFVHFYRHHRRHRITEGSEEIRMRKVVA